MVRIVKSGGLILVLIAMLAGPVLAAPDGKDTPGRYSMTATENGMLRLDTHTGAVSLCTGTAGRWVCRSVADDRLALENEIDRLSVENQRLKAELAQRGSDVKPEMNHDAQPKAKPQPEAPGSWRPSEKDVEEFMTFFEKIMKRFKQIAEDMQSDDPEKQP